MNKEEVGFMAQGLAHRAAEGQPGQRRQNRAPKKEKKVTFGERTDKLAQSAREKKRKTVDTTNTTGDNCFQIGPKSDSF